jgi:predicted DCC family thiol-disulfide oxidoreductase YuxK
MNVVLIVALSNTVKVYTDNVGDVAQLEELLGQRGYEPAAETLWLQLLPTPARAVAEASHLARTLRRRGYRVVTRLL